MAEIHAGTEAGIDRPVFPLTGKHRGDGKTRPEPCAVGGRAAGISRRRPAGRVLPHGRGAPAALLGMRRPDGRIESTGILKRTKNRPGTVSKGLFTEAERERVDALWRLPGRRNQ